MVYINTLAVQIREDGRAKGWGPVTLDDWTYSDHRVPTFLALIHSEIVEAYAETGSDSPDVFLAAELADIQIRTLDLAGGLTADFAYYVEMINPHAVEFIVPTDYAELFNKMHSFVTDALEAFRVDNKSKCVNALAQLYVIVDFVAAQYYQIDLPLAIERKMAFNKTRPHKNGDKRV